jgi:hypothetical protein
MARRVLDQPKMTDATVEEQGALFLKAPIASLGLYPAKDGKRERAQYRGVSTVKMVASERAEGKTPLE